MNRKECIHIFCEEIWRWYARNKRTLPWRDLDDTDLDHKAYLVMVSEIMLQQTQVSRVTVLYKKFIHTFPTIQELAKASNTEILIAWRGLGYNNRALRLRDAARTLTSCPHPHLRQGSGGQARPLPQAPLRRRSWERGDSHFPREMDALMDLPGIGHYTAAAICNFAFGIPTPCIDVNIRRILHRFFVGIENVDGTWKKDDKYLLKLAEEVLQIALTIPTSPTQPTSPSHWHAALMDFGSLVMTKNSPKWDEFTPKMKSICLAYGKQISRTPVPDPSKGSVRGAAKKLRKQEPGRMMAGRFVPNRIFRGKIIEVLRDARTKLTIEQLGEKAIADWSFGDHRVWMQGLLKKLAADRMIEKSAGRYMLHR